jgi:hypothetical protein
MEPSPPATPNLISCPDCGHRISKSAMACPSCGAPPPRRRIKLRDAIIILASVAWGAFQASGRGMSVISGIIAGFIVGIVFAGIVRALMTLARWFREKAPRAASITGKIVFWLGIALAIYFAGVTAYAIYEGASATLGALLAGIGVTYGLVGWGVRYALSDRNH